MPYESCKFSDCDINDDFFDSLRTDYPEFNEWFLKKSDEDAYVYRDENGVQAFLYIKQYE